MQLPTLPDSLAGSSGAWYPPRVPASPRDTQRDCLEALDDPSVLAQIGEILIAAGIDLAVVHGSRARRDARPDSDLDIGVLAAGAHPLSYRTMGELALDLSNILAVEVDVADLATRDAIFRYEVAQSARPIFQRRPESFADFLAKAMIDHADIERFLPELVAAVARKGRGQPATGNATSRLRQ